MPRVPARGHCAIRRPRALGNRFGAPSGPNFSTRIPEAPIIDRDDWTDEVVEASWKSFPDPTCDNLLIWRRKELESYFLEPEWVCESRYVQSSVTPERLQEWLASEADKRLLFEAVNRVLIKTRNAIKRGGPPLPSFNGFDGLDEEQVLQKVLRSPLLEHLGTVVEVEVSEARIRAAFAEEVRLLSGGSRPLTWGTGRWRDLASGKPLFRAMVNRWFFVPDLQMGGGARLTGRDAEYAVALELLSLRQGAMPADFSELRSVLDRVL